MEVTNAQMMHELMNIHMLVCIVMSAILLRTRTRENSLSSSIYALIWMGYAVFIWANNTY